jgi:hypothetical protein
MSGRFSRNKGIRGENEICKLLTEELGFKVERDLSQTREGKNDVICIPNWSIQVKYQEKLNLNEWWDQTLEFCGDDEPILFFRRSREQWKAMIYLGSINRDFHGMPYTCIVDFQTACMLIRETL